MELGEWLEAAEARYGDSWAVVDEELRALCTRRGNRNLLDVYAKVAIVNRVYVAGITRIVRPKCEGADPEMSVAEMLVPMASTIESLLPLTEPGRLFSSQALVTIVDVHGRIVSGLARELNCANLRSFVSKYLHFHCPLVPIYDSLAAAAITKVLGPYVSRWREPQEVLTIPQTNYQEVDPTYFWYCARFLELWELAQRVRPRSTVKIIDHALWDFGDATKMARKDAGILR